MIVEQRTYTFHPGKLDEFLSIYQAEGMAIQTSHLPRMIGYFFTEMGELNQVIHMWAYDDHGHRAACRARLGADPEWKVYLGKVLPLIVNMKSSILIPTSFSPIS